VSDPTDKAEFEASMAKQSLTPEQQLMFSLVEDAIKSIGAPHGARSRELRENDIAWINDRANRSIFSFQSCCDHLRLDADFIRKGILAGKIGVGQRATCPSCSHRWVMQRRHKKIACPNCKKWIPVRVQEPY
jgi:predicted RNA-binding Zn-ribbon protein involved in translation (DUF1610 family)